MVAEMDPDFGTAVPLESPDGFKFDSNTCGGYWYEPTVYKLSACSGFRSEKAGLQDHPKVLNGRMTCNHHVRDMQATVSWHSCTGTSTTVPAPRTNVFPSLQAHTLLRARVVLEATVKVVHSLRWHSLEPSIHFLPFGFVLKSSHRVREQEGLAMNLARALGIPAPRFISFGEPLGGCNAWIHLALFPPSMTRT